MIAAAIVSIGFTACNNANDAAGKDAEILNMYVDSVQGLTPVYTVESWTVFDNGYQERAIAAEKNYAALSAEGKAKADASKRLGCGVALTRRRETAMNDDQTRSQQAETRTKEHPSYLLGVGGVSSKKGHDRR